MARRLRRAHRQWHMAAASRLRHRNPRRMDRQEFRHRTDEDRGSHRRPLDRHPQGVASRLSTPAHRHFHDLQTLAARGTFSPVQAPRRGHIVSASKNTDQPSWPISSRGLVMKRLSFVMGVAALCAYAAVSFAQATSSASRLQSLGAADPSSTTHFSVYFPLTNQVALDQLVNDQTNSASPNYHKWLTPAEFNARFGPNPADMARVSARLEAAGFTITASHTQSIEVTGPVALVENLFSTRLNQMRTVRGQTRFSAANHKLSMPNELASAGVVIPAFFPELSAHVHSVKLAAGSAAAGRLTTTSNASPNQRIATGALFYLPDDLNEAYSLPSFQTEAGSLLSPKKKQIAGVGAHIGIVISSVIDPADINSSFNQSLQLPPFLDIQDYSAVSNLPVPSVTIRPVDGGSGPFNPNSDDATEASLDTQMSLGTAPGAQETLYDMPDLSDDSVTEAYALVDEDNVVDVVSSSFGECELDFTPGYNNGTDFTGILKTFHSLFQQGNAQGITFLASSGDNGALSCLSAAFANNPTN